MVFVMNPSVKLQFPNLSEKNYSETSPISRHYNCIAWAAGDDRHFWWPQYAYWPTGLSSELTVDNFMAAFQTLGYEACDGPELEPGFEKIAIYTKMGAPTHAARQLSNGYWTSKLGRNIDIEHHSLEAIEGPAYGKAFAYMKRPTSS